MAFSSISHSVMPPILEVPKKEEVQKFHGSFSNSKGYDDSSVELLKYMRLESLNVDQTIPCLIDLTSNEVASKKIYKQLTAPIITFHPYQPHIKFLHLHRL